jgi:ubiquinone/menaquinone biosynthesis C-methylase UbiE
MNRINFLESLPKVVRNVEWRGDVKSKALILEAKKFGANYFDGDRSTGYGGYTYDGRWRSVAKNIIQHYGIKPGMKILDVGCAKGFLVKDFILEDPRIEAFGLDISEYALLNCEPEVIGRLHLGSAENLPFPTNSFDCVVSINTLHNLPRVGVIKAISEIERVSKGRSFIQVDSYFSAQQKELFEKWVLTAEYHDFPEKWLETFQEACYTGDYDWTIVE